MNKPSLSKMWRMLVVCAIVGISSCSRNDKQPDPVPEPEPEQFTDNDTQRGFTKKTDDMIVEMPEEVIYVKEDINKGMQDYNPETGVISFHNSQELERQGIKEGDILYSAERTEKAPNGYCLRVVSVSREGDTVTYQTEPASALEVFDHLEESGTLMVGDLKPEDIMVYSLTYGGDDSQTKALDISLDHGLSNFEHTADHTSFEWVFYRHYSSTDPSKLVYQVSMEVELQHEFFEDKASFFIENGIVIIFGMMKTGATVRLILEAPGDINEEESLLEWKNVQNNLLDKKFDIVEIPIPFGLVNLVVNPSFVFSVQFGLDATGQLTAEASFKDQVMAFNLQNTDSYSLNFFKETYLRSVSHGNPDFRIMADASLDAYISAGPGLKFEIPSLQRKEDGKWRSSYVGFYVLGTLRGHADISSEIDPLSGTVKFDSHGSGELAVEGAVQGKIGFSKWTAADIDYRFDFYVQSLGEWDWQYYIESPTPYNLQTEVDGTKAVLSWESRDTGMLSVVYDIYLDAGEGYVLYKPAWPEKRYEFDSDEDGFYKWKVTSRTGSGKQYPCAQEQEFIIATSSAVTKTPEIDAKLLKVSVSGSYTTRNPVKEYGIAFCDTKDFSGDVGYHNADGPADHFTVELCPVPNHSTIYARAYVKISCRGGGEQLVYGNAVKITIDEPDIQLTVSPEKLDFGDVAVGKKKTLELDIVNEGFKSGRIKVTSPDDGFPVTFDWTERSIKEDGREALYVTFQPAEIKEKWDSSFALDAYDEDGNAIQRVLIPISGASSQEVNAKPGIRFSEYSVPFGSVEVGKTAQLTRTVYNTGTADLVITSVSCSENAFTASWTSATIEPGKSKDVTITFKPAEIRQYSAKMQFVCNVENADDASLGLSGVGEAAKEAGLSVSPKYLDFPDTQIGQTSQLTWTITNSGNATLTVSSLTVPDGFSTDFSGWSSKTLDPGTSHTFKVTFSPTEVKTYLDEMVLKSNAANNPEASFKIGGKCVAAPEPKVTVSRTSLDFPDTQAGQTSELTWTITNSGNATLNVYSLTVPEGFSTDFSSWSSKSLEPGASHTFKVSFSPKEVKTYSGKMVMKSNVSNAPEASFTIGGHGVAAPEPKVTVSKTSLDFPDTQVGETSELTWTITNSGNATVNVYSLTVPDGFSTDFSGWSSKSLEPGDSHSFKVSFSPKEVKTYSGKMVMKSNVSNSPEASFTIGGKGIDANGAELSTSSSYLVFQDTKVGETSQLTWTITNSGQKTLNVYSLTVPDGFSTDFSGWSSKSLEPGASHTFKVFFSPTAVKTYSGRMVIKTNAGNTPEASFTIGGKGVSDGTSSGGETLASRSYNGKTYSIILRDVSSNYRANGDGSKYYSCSFTIKAGNNTYDLPGSYYAYQSENSFKDRGPAVAVNSSTGDIWVFFIEKDTDEYYGMCGHLFHISGNSITKQTLFTAANFGWFPYFTWEEGQFALNCFAFSGYFAIIAFQNEDWELYDNGDIYPNEFQAQQQAHEIIFIR